MMLITFERCSKCKKEGKIDSMINYTKRISTSGELQRYFYCQECNTERAKKYRGTIIGKEKIYQAAKNARKKYRKKHNARKMLNHYIKLGKIQKEACYCGETKVDGHHTDYTKPLEVIWLCRKHHALLHKKLKEI